MDFFSFLSSCVYRRDLSGPVSVGAPLSHSSSDHTDTSNDLLLAQMLQLEFDREHDRLLHAEERQFNRDSKGEGEAAAMFPSIFFP